MVNKNASQIKTDCIQKDIYKKLFVFFPHVKEIGFLGKYNKL